MVHSGDYAKIKKEDRETGSRAIEEPRVK